MALRTFIAGVLLAEKRVSSRSWKLPSILQGLLLGPVLYFGGMALNLSACSIPHLLWVVVSVAIPGGGEDAGCCAIMRVFTGLRSSERMQFASVFKPGERVRVVLFSAASSQKLFKDDQMALAAGDGRAVYDDHAAADEAGRINPLSRRLNPTDDEDDGAVGGRR